jgi:2-desacetyl-2-hydroxyethyl bacteriochlorophyllide A dehydrogenase
VKVIAYGGPGVLELQEREKPVPAEGQVLLAVSHVGICGSDLLIWEGGLPRVPANVVMGHEFSAVIADPNGQAGLSAGDRVVVEPLLNCGECGSCRRGSYNACARLRLIGIDVDGAAADFVVAPAHRVHAIPDELSLRDAALAEPTAVACHMADRAGVSSGSTVVVVGGGPIGALVALVCRARGAARVVVSEPAEDRRTLIQQLGLEVFDPVAHGLDRLIADIGGDGADVTFELTAVPAGLAAAIEAARPQGTVLLGGLPNGPIPVATAPAILKELALVGARVYRAEHFTEAIRLLAEGAVPADRLITRVVPLPDAVEGAYTRLRDIRTDMKILIEPGERTEK